MEATDLPLWYLRGIAIVWGALWGSFANVMIYRWPLGISVLSPPSHCPHCEKRVRWYDNVPVFGWLWLRGKCRDCKAPISPRYPFIEALYALVGFVVVERLLRHEVDLNLPTFAALFFLRFAFVWGLLTASFIDLERFLLPDVITLGGTALGLIASFLLPGIGWKTSLFGAGLGYAIPFTLYFIWSRFLKRDGMGLGDAKLLAMVGAFLGPPGVLFALSAGSAQGIVATVVSRVTGWRIGPDPKILEEDDEDEDDDEGHEAATPETKPAEADGAITADAETEDEDPGLMRTLIPFGPFLALGAVEYMFGGDALVRLWLTWMQGGEL